MKEDRTAAAKEYPKKEAALEGDKEEFLDACKALYASKIIS